MPPKRKGPKKYQIVNEIEITKIQIKSWLENPPDNLRIREIFTFPSHYDPLRDFLNSDKQLSEQDFFAKKDKFGLLAESVGELILLRDFVLDRSYLFNTPDLRVNHDSNTFKLFLIDKMKLDSLFLAKAFNNQPDIHITNSDFAFTSFYEESNLINSILPAKEHFSFIGIQDWGRFVFIRCQAFNPDHPKYKPVSIEFVKDNFEYGLFRFTTKTDLLEKIAFTLAKEKEREIQESPYLDPIKEKGLTISRFYNIGLREIYKYLFPLKKKTLFNWNSFLAKKERTFKRFHYLASFLGLNTRLDTNYFLNQNSSVVTYEMDVWAIPRTHSELYSKL